MVFSFKQAKLYLLLLCTVFLLAGCWDTNEPERMIYIHGLGVDYHEGQYTVYVQILNTALNAKSESKGGVPSVKILVGSASGKTLNEALFHLYSSAQRRLFWGSLSFIIFSEEALKHGGHKAAIDRFDRYYETRYSLHIFATKEPLADILISIPIGLTSYQSRLSDPEESYNQRSFIPPINMRELLIAVNEPPHEAIIPLLSLTKHSWVTETGSTPLPRTSGVAIISKDQLKQIAPFNKINGLRWDNNQFKREELTLSKELSYVSLIVWKVKVKKNFKVKENRITFHLSFDINATVSEMVKPERLAKIQKEAERVIKQEIEDTFREGIQHHVDIFRLSEEVYRKDIGIWKKREENGKIPLTDESIENITVKVKVMQGEKQKLRPTL